MKQINPRHKQFCDEYLTNGMNGTEAYKKVYPKSSEDAARNNGARLLANDSIKEYIAEKRKKTEQKFELKREDMLKSLLNRAKLVDEMQELASKSKLTPEEEGKYTRLLMMLKASDANKAWEQIAKLQGWNEPDKQEVTHKGLTINYIKPKDEGTDN